MMAEMQQLHLTANWFQAHPLSFTFILAALFFVLGLYGTELKTFIANWPKEQFHNIRYNLAVADRKWLGDMFNNSYRLVLYYGYNVCWVLLWYAVVYTASKSIHFTQIVSGFAPSMYYSIGVSNLI